MGDDQLISELVKALNSVQAELQQMNKSLSAIAAVQGPGQSRPSYSEPGARPAGRPPSRPPSKTTYTSGYKRSEGVEGGESKEGFRYPKKAGPSRTKGKFPPPKKGGGYPKKPR